MEMILQLEASAVCSFCALAGKEGSRGSRKCQVPYAGRLVERRCFSKENFS